MEKLFIQKIKKAALEDKKKRKSSKYLKTMGFLTRKGFLKANQDFSKFKHGKLDVKAAIWAGKEVEPRILEVLPAVLVRLPKEVYSMGIPKELQRACEALKSNLGTGPSFMGVPFKKYKVWMDLNILDQRTKPAREKKQMCSFRLSPKVIKKLENHAQKLKLTKVQVLEELIEDIL